MSRNGLGLDAPLGVDRGAAFLEPKRPRGVQIALAAKWSAKTFGAICPTICCMHFASRLLLFHPPGLYYMYKACISGLQAVCFITGASAFCINQLTLLSRRNGKQRVQMSNLFSSFQPPLDGFSASTLTETYIDWFCSSVCDIPK